MSSTRAPMRVAAVFLGVLALSLLSCGREPTGPVSVPVNAFKRVASLAVSPQYETALRSSALHAALSQVAFEKVRITLRREDGTIALDTVVDFPAGVDSLTLSLIVPLPVGAPSTGVPMSLNLGYVNAAGDTVFRGGPIPVTATPPTAGGAPPPPVQVPVHYTGTGANATSVTITPKSFGGRAGQSAIFSAVAKASDGTVIAGTPIVFSSSDASVVRISNPSSGNADFLARGSAKVYAQLLTGQADSATVTVTLPAARLELTSGGGQTAAAGTTLPQSVVARVVASDGVGVGGITVNFAVASGGGSVTSASVVSASDGSASTSWKLGNGAGAQSLSVTSSGLAGSPLTVNATATIVTPTKLTVITQPGSGGAGAPLPTVAVAAQDANGVTVATFAGDVTVALGANPGGASLSGTTTVTAVNGVASFGGLSVNKPGNGYTFVFSSSGLAGATSSTFNIVAGSAAKLAFGAMPAAVDAGLAIVPAVTVTAQDSAGNTVTSFTGTVTVGIGANPGSGTLSGTRTATAVAGVATFSDLSINKKGASYTLVASATGLAGGTSAAFNVSPTAATGISVVSGAGQTALPGTALKPISLQLHDALGNGIANATITLAIASGGGSLSSTSLVTDANGLVNVTWTLGGGTGTQSITATFGSLPTTTLTATATAPVTTGGKLALTTPPGATQTAGIVFSPSVVVQAQDTASQLLTGFTGVVTATVLSGPVGATVSGTASATAVGGIATFNALRLRKAGTYVLQFTSSGLLAVSTTSIVVNATSAAIILADSGQGQVGTAGTTLAQKLVVLVTDSTGNPITGRSINWAVASGGGSVDTATTVTNTAGRTRVRFTLGATGSTNSVTATSTGLTGSPVTFTASIGTPPPGPVASTVLSAHLDTLTSINATFGLTAQAKDGAGANVTGAFTWASRNAAIATVDVSGGVRAIGNGSTYVVATETGGTKDSALIVVQQRLATINVTPSTSSMHVGDTRTFTANAVDGLGSPLASQPSFTWASNNVSLASVSGAGLVTAVSLGNGIQITATSGAVTGVSTVNVTTRITRIAVAVDSGGSTTTDIATLPSLGLHRTYLATAYDSANNVLSGKTFNWVSSNGSVANIDSAGTASTKARVITAANGVTSIQATAEGVTSAPSASLTVSQVLAAISLTPASATIAMTGTQPLVARGLDANARPIGTTIAFTYTSSAPAIATVSGTGVVTGVTLGNANITATSGAITSNIAVMTVANTGVPAVISFGRDTLSVGRGSSTSIPVFLSKPYASPLTVNLAVADTMAFWSTASVTIPANQTSVNATLNGHNAGTTTVTATDGSGAGYAAATSVLAVQATLRLTNGGYAMNATDQASTQVLLSDPSPAGGTYVTFNFSTAGKASVSPNPAFIPAGQLAADIQILGLAGGSTNITPSAIGVNGTASSVTVYTPVITATNAAQRLGAGQFESNNYLYLPAYNTLAVPITLTSSDTTVATVQPSLTIPANGNYVYYTISAKNPGSATVTYSSPGWSAAGTIAVTSTTPYVGLCCGTTLNTTSPASGFTVYAEDSVRNSHYRTSSLVVHLSSSDTTVLKVLDSVVTIAPGQYYNNVGRVIPGGTGGTAKLRATASGHAPDSTTYTVVGPKLEFNWATNRVGVGQEDNNLYVYSPNNVLTPLVVTLTADTSKTGIPATVTIPAGTNYAYFTVRGKAPGTVPIIASALGYQGDTATYIVTSPRLTHSGGGTLRNFQPASSFYIYSTDSLGNGHYRSTPLAITLRSTDTTVIKTDTVATIPAGQYYTATPPLVTAINTGTAKIIVTAAGHPPDTLTYTVVVPNLSFSFYSTLIGKGQNFGGSSFYVYTPDTRTSALTVTFTQKRPSIETLSATTLSIPSGTNVAYFGMSALATGTDTIIASAPGYTPDTAFFTVSSPKFTNGGLPGTTTTTNPPISVTVYATDSVGNGHYVNADVVVKALTSDSTVLRPTQDYFHILANAYYAQPTFNVIGPGTASITFSDSAGTGYASTTTNTMTVTGPSLTIQNGSPVLGMRQNSGPSGWYVYTPNNVATPLTVNLASSGTRVATVPASVVIPTGYNYAYFMVSAQDTLGTVQVTATATGYNASSSNVQVTAPKFTVSYASTLNTTSPPSTLTIYATDANGTSHYVNENVTVTLASSATSVATIDSSAVGVTIVAGQYYTQAAHWLPGVVGTAQLTMSDARAVFYKYGSGTASISVITPALNFSFSNTPLGIGQYVDNVYAYVPDYTNLARTVGLSHTGTARTSTLVGGSPVSSVTIPALNNYVYFRVVGISAGVDSLVGTLASPAHTPAVTATTVGLGRMDPLGGWPGSLAVGDSALITLYARDPATNARYVQAATTFTLAPNANVKFVSGGVSSVTITSVTIPADQYYVQFYLKGVSSGAGSASITATNYVTYTNTVTVP